MLHRCEIAEQTCGCGLTELVSVRAGLMGNRHLVIALMVTPLLAMAGWWASGLFADHEPVPAQKGSVYPLLEKSNCRYASGRCLLENVDFTIALTYGFGSDGHFLIAQASHPLSNILLAVAEDEQSAPQAMERRDTERQEWRLALDGRPSAAARIRLVARNADVTWYGDAATHFIEAPVPGVQ